MAATSSVPFSFEGKSAIVTGAGSGINLSFAEKLLSRGCNVLFADLGLRPEAKAVVEEYSSKSPNKPLAFFQQTDVTDWSQLERMFTVAQEQFGDIDLVCPGAGVFDPDSSTFWHPPGTSKSKDSVDGGRYAALDINITHPIRTTQLAISHFLSERSGSKASITNPKRIVLIGSIVGQKGLFPAPIYCAAKHAITGLTRSLEPLEDSLGIRVNAVAPGIIKTPLFTDNPDKEAWFDDSQDVWATPEEVADAMLALAEDPDMPGGTILEVGHKQTRKVPVFNNPGPSGAGHTMSNSGIAVQEVYRLLADEGWGNSK